ncbi:Hypothetical_protein [Hexamita inflata]|uniref:Hypothetical_protein n=1 Tax=Hexamita inflata TaxID=28002 RepID=A0AA86U449_9EUKA|nr:Hypothetical protein HINF_LOCUS12243 [Hexamita inflata]CAI9937272.1 Hypothetical protein HINF_LOCUS24917 [Hexamita inflata]
MTALFDAIRANNFELFQQSTHLLKNLNESGDTALFYLIKQYALDKTKYQNHQELLQMLGVLFASEAEIICNNQHVLCLCQQYQLFRELAVYHLFGFDCNKNAFFIEASKEQFVVQSENKILIVNKNEWKIIDAEKRTEPEILGIKRSFFYQQ